MNLIFITPNNFHRARKVLFFAREMISNKSNLKEEVIGRYGIMIVPMAFQTALEACSMIAMVNPTLHAWLYSIFLSITGRC